MAPDLPAVIDIAGLQQRVATASSSFWKGPNTAGCTQESSYLTMGSTSFKNWIFFTFGEEGALLSMQ